MSRLSRTIVHSRCKPATRPGRQVGRAGPDGGPRATFDLGTSLEDLLAAVATLGEFGRVNGAVFLYNEATQSLSLGTQWGQVQDPPCLHGGSAECWIWHAWRSKQLVFPAEQVKADTLSSCATACSYPADVYVPLVADTRCLGVVALWLGSEPSSDMLGFLHALAPHLALAVDRACGYDEVRRQSRDLRVLAQVGQLLTSTLDLGEVLDLAVREARALLHADGTRLLLVDETSQALVLEAAAGSGADGVKRVRVDADAGIAGCAFRERRSVLASGVPAESRFRTEIDADGRSDGGALVAVPILCKGRAIGVIEVLNSQAGSFGARDVNVLEALAGYAAIAIANARLYEAERELRRVSAESQAQVAQSDRLASVGRMTASLAHELNNPLQALHNSLQVILEFPLDDDEKDSYIKMADEEVARLIDMVSRILEFSRRPMDEVKAVELNAVTRRVMELAAKYLQHQHITLDMRLADSLPVVAGNPGHLGQVLLNLVINAVEAMPSGGTLRVVTEADNNGGVLLRVVDTGQGMSPETLSRLYEPFFSTKRQGTGLGLSISQNIVSQHGGTIEARSVLGQGSEFEVRLPVMGVSEQGSR